MLALSDYKCFRVRVYGQVKEHMAWSEASSLHGQHGVYVGSAEPYKVEDLIIFCLLIFLALFLMSVMRAIGQARELFVTFCHLLYSRPLCALISHAQFLVWTGNLLVLSFWLPVPLTCSFVSGRTFWVGISSPLFYSVLFCLMCVCVCMCVWVNWEMWVQISIWMVSPLSWTQPYHPVLSFTQQYLQYRMKSEELEKACFSSSKQEN